MKILYVTHLWSALSECLFDEVTEIRVMQAFLSFAGVSEE